MKLKFRKKIEGLCEAMFLCHSIHSNERPFTSTSFDKRDAFPNY